MNKDKKPEDEKTRPLQDLLSGDDRAFTPSEERIVQVLLSDFPTAGLGTASALARRAGVSDPTVIRLVAKLGFSGYADFQARLLAEIESQLHSPLLMMEAKRARAVETGSETGVAGACLASIAEAMTRTVGTTPPTTFERAARLVAGARGQVLVLGGRFSRHVAGMLVDYLIQLRANVRNVGRLSAASFDDLVDVDRRDVVVVFDYRRYQRDVMAFAGQAAERGARIVLFTDPWMSPVAEHADVTIVSPVEVASPYDTLAPAVAQIEAFVGEMLTAMDDPTRARIEALEGIRRRNAVTLDETPRLATGADAETTGRAFPGPKPTVSPSHPPAPDAPEKDLS